MSIYASEAILCGTHALGRSPLGFPKNLLENKRGDLFARRKTAVESQMEAE